MPEPTRTVPVEGPQRIEPLRRSHRVEHAAFRCAYSCFAKLPRATAVRCGARLGTLFYLFDRPHRRIALRNLEIALPDKSERERRSILRRACRNLGRVAAEFCHLDALTPETVRRYVAIGDPAAYRRAVVERDHGVVVLTGHFGNWELLAYAQGLLGDPVTLVHRPLRNPLVDAAISRIRAGAGTRAIKKKAAAKEALRVLRARGLVVIPADQNQPRRDGVFVEFFGLPASTTPGAARLAMMTGATVLPVFLVREGETDRHRMVILPEIEMVHSGDRHADIVTNTQRCTVVIERMVREHPNHWIWFHKRWRTRPAGEPRIY